MLIMIICVLLTASAAFAAIKYVTRTIPYIPPPFEPNAVEGIPEPPTNMGYSPVDAEGGYAFALAGNLYRQENGDLCIYFTNPDDSNVWMMCEIESHDYGVIYKSGVLKQGEYIERLTPLTEFPNEATKIEIKIYGFEPENWQSKGTVYLNTTLQPW